MISDGSRQYPYFPSKISLHFLEGRSLHFLEGPSFRFLEGPSLRFLEGCFHPTLIIKEEEEEEEEEKIQIPLIKPQPISPNLSREVSPFLMIHFFLEGRRKILRAIPSVFSLRFFPPFFPSKFSLRFFPPNFPSVFSLRFLEGRVHPIYGGMLSSNYND